MSSIGDLAARVSDVEDGRSLLDALNVQLESNGEKLDDLAARLANAEVAIKQATAPSQPGPSSSQQQQPNQNGQTSVLTRQIIEEQNEGARETLIQLALRDHAKSLQSNPCLLYTSDAADD